MFLFFCYVIDTIRINSSRPSHLNEQRQRTIVRALQMVSTTGQDGLSGSKSKQLLTCFLFGIIVGQCFYVLSKSQRDTETIFFATDFAAEEKISYSFYED